MAVGCDYKKQFNQLQYLGAIALSYPLHFLLLTTHHEKMQQLNANPTPNPQLLWLEMALFSKKA